MSRHAATTLNVTPVSLKASKYVADIRATAGSPWNITIEVEGNATNGIPATIDGQTLVLSPNIQNVAPTSASQGSIDWACTSATNITAAARGLGNASTGTLPAKYVPAECR